MTIDLARVTIHSPTVRPLVDELGQDIEPAKATNFAIEKVKLVPPFEIYPGLMA